YDKRPGIQGIMNPLGAPPKRTISRKPRDFPLKIRRYIDFPGRGVKGFILSRCNTERDCEDERRKPCEFHKFCSFRSNGMKPRLLHMVAASGEKRKSKKAAASLRLGADVKIAPRYRIAS